MIDKQDWIAATAKLRLGEAVEGRVVAVTDFGIFVDIGLPVLALIHGGHLTEDRAQRIPG